MTGLDMTDQHPLFRWRTAAAVAPTAAAVLAFVTGWAVAHPPSGSGTATIVSADASVNGSVDPNQSSLTKQMIQTQGNVTHLEKSAKLPSL